jgi:hypothetical protein
VIVALPSTLTGSIGVLGGKLVTEQFAHRLGVTTGTVQQGDRALMYSSRRGFSEDERARFGVMIDAIYDDFVAKVAAGRSRPGRGDRNLWPAAGYGLAGMRPKQAWSMSWAVFATPFASPESAPICPTMHLC